MNTDFIGFLRENKPFLTLLLSFAIAAFLLPHLGQLAAKIGLIDQPNKRKIHGKPKPLVGGLAMSLAVALTGLLFIPLFNMRGVFAGMILLVITGFLDDFNELNHRYKFVAQIIAAVFMMYFSKIYLHTFGNILPFGSIDFDMLAIPVTIVAIVGVCNSINMIDGLDGLAGGICLTVFCTFAYISFIIDRPIILLLSLSICGSLIAFLIYNWNPAKLFMGDAGSLFLGFAAGSISIALTQEQDGLVILREGHKNLTSPVIPLLVLAVPIVDTVTIMVKRLLKGKNPFHADKGHLHHVLLKMGYGKKQAATIIVMLSALFCSLAIAGTMLKIPEYYLFFLFLAYFICYFVASFFIKPMIRNRKKLSVRFITSLF